MSQLDDFRAAKDAYFGAPDSPLLSAQRATFTGLAYYPEAPELALLLEPEPPEDLSKVVALQTSTGDAAEYLRWAVIRFNVDGREVSLTVFREVHSWRLFLPFADANAGGETYGAGRYLDVEALDDGRLLVDFNYAYNPYCAYNDAWSCPLTPPENRLPVAIRAGERVFSESH